MKRYCTNCKKFFSIPNRMEGVVCKCPMCGHVEESLPDKDMFLKAETVLKDRYTIGKYIKYSETSITYRAWDKERDTLVAVIEFYPKAMVERIEGLKVTAKCNMEHDQPDHSDETENEKKADKDIKNTEFSDGKERFLEEAHKLAENDSEEGSKCDLKDDSKNDLNVEPKDNSMDDSKDDSVDSSETENVLVQDIFEENGTAYIVLNIL